MDINLFLQIDLELIMKKKDNELNYISELAIIPKTSGKYII